MSSSGHNKYEDGQSIKLPDFTNPPKSPAILPKVKALQGGGNWHVSKIKHGITIIPAIISLKVFTGFYWLPLLYLLVLLLYINCL